MRDNNDIDLVEFLTEPSEPWKRSVFIGGSGLFCAGWTNESKIFLLFQDYYVIANPITGEREEVVEDSDLLQYLSKDNLEFKIEKINQKIKVFGIRGGEGNHYTSDFWSLRSFYINLDHFLIGLENLKNRRKHNIEYWKNYDLIKLERLEYTALKFGFSPDEKHFGIFGSSGVEIFSRSKVIAY